MLRIATGLAAAVPAVALGAQTAPPNARVIHERVLDAGYTPADLEKIWSANALRLLRAADAAREIG